MINKDIIAKLQNIVGKDAVLTSKEDLHAYSYDATATWSHMPDLVILPDTVEQIAIALDFAFQFFSNHPQFDRKTGQFAFQFGQQLTDRIVKIRIAVIAPALGRPDAFEKNDV